jgi:hypothetical protein
MVDTGVVVDMELDWIGNLVNTDPEVWKKASSKEHNMHFEDCKKKIKSQNQQQDTNKCPYST